MRSSRYGSYRGRSRLSTFLKVLVVILLLLLIAAAAALVLGILDPYQVYSADGIRLNLPFLQQQEQESPPPPTASQSLVITQTETPAPTPAPESAQVRGVLLSRQALQDGTAQQQVEAAGANAAVFDMKADDGSLGYVSQLELAIGGEVSASDPGLNDAIETLCGGELYTIARVSCFRDNAMPRMRNSLALRTVSGYNWLDPEGMRWLSPANDQVQEYLAGVCRELAALGFDEIFLDNAAFPVQGNTDSIQTGENYDPQQFSTELESFYALVRQALADYPDVKLSIAAQEGVFAREGEEIGGQSAGLLCEYADWVWTAEQLPDRENGETPGMPAIYPILEESGPEQGSWLVLGGAQ